MGGDGAALASHWDGHGRVTVRAHHGTGAQPEQSHRRRSRQDVAAFGFTPLDLVADAVHLIIFIQVGTGLGAADGWREEAFPSSAAVLKLQIRSRQPSQKIKIAQVAGLGLHSLVLVKLVETCAYTAQPAYNKCTVCVV